MDKTPPSLDALATELAACIGAVLAAAVAEGDSLSEEGRRSLVLGAETLAAIVSRPELVETTRAYVEALPPTRDTTRIFRHRA